MKKILLLDWSFEWRFYILDALKELNVDVYVVLPELRDQTEYFQKIFIIENLYENPKSHFDEINNIVRSNDIDAIYTSEDELIMLSSLIMEENNLLEINSSLVNICMDKFLLRKNLENKGVEMPLYQELTTIEELEAFLSINTDYPFILKPLDGNFSDGTVKINNKNEIIKAWKESAKSLINSPSQSKKLIIEEFLGEDNSVISCEVLIQNKQIFLVGLTKETFSMYKSKDNIEKFKYDFIEVPANISPKIKKLIYQHVISIIQVLNLNNMTLHVEYKIKNNIPYLIEVNPRMAGGLIPYLYKRSLGIDLSLLSIKIALNIPINNKDLKYNKEEFTIIKFINHSYNGVINHISTDYYVPDNELLRLTMSEGDEYNQGEVFGIGYYIFDFNNDNEKNKKIETMMNNLKLEIVNKDDK
nr:ATP-grasp domain-containing protein [Mammaliicoccus sp. Marseille-Q6498]